MVVKRQIVALVAVATLWGCRDLLDANDFEVAEPTPKTHRPRPFYDETCLSCAADRCAAESATCDAQEDCRTQLACSLPCTTPDCLVACWLPYNDHPTPIHTVDDCMLNECPDECRRFNNYECTGNWGWSRLYPGGEHPPDASITIEEGFTGIIDGLPLPGLRVQTSGVEGITDAAGRISLTVPLGLTGHTDLLRVDDPTGENRILPTAIHRGDPRRDRFHYAGWEMTGGDDVDLISALIGAEGYDPERAYVGIRLWDCQRDSAPGLVVAINSADERTVISYIEGGLPTADLEQTTRPAVVLIMHVPPGLARITSTHVATGQTTHKLNYVFVAGEVLSLRLWPLTTQEVE